MFISEVSEDITSSKNSQAALTVIISSGILVFIRTCEAELRTRFSQSTKATTGADTAGLCNLVVVQVEVGAQVIHWFHALEVNLVSQNPSNPSKSFHELCPFL